MRARGFSSWVISSESRSAFLVAWWTSSSPSAPALVTSRWLGPSWVLLRRRAVFLAVSFSKITSADLVSPSWVTLRSAILPLEDVSCEARKVKARSAYQKLKKSLISLSLVDEAMFLTLIVELADMMNAWLCLWFGVVNEGYQACCVEV